MAVNLNSDDRYTDSSHTRIVGRLDRMAEGLELLEAELLLAALRNQTHLSSWTHDQLSILATALDNLRDAVDSAPRTPD